MYDEGLTGLAAGGEISLFSLQACGIKENLKAGYGMVKGGREVESWSYSWRDAGIRILFVCLFCFVLFCFFFRPGNEVGNGNVLDIHDYTIP